MFMKDNFSSARRKLQQILLLILSLILLNHSAGARNVLPVRALVNDFDVTDSKQCLNQCIREGGVFCEEFSWATPGARGVCCDKLDADC